MTVTEAYQQAIQRLQAASTMEHEEATTIARQVVDRLISVRYAHLLHPAQTLSAAQQQRWQAMLDELLNGRPLAYVLGAREFYGLTFRCNERALIPRPETETLVEAAIKRLQQRDQVAVADLGTGTGCIAISIARALPDASVYATDVSPDALDLASANARLNGVSERIHFLSGDISNWAAPLVNHCLFDAILSNPPYIATTEIPALQPQIRDWEPHVALASGDGFDCYRAIAKQCREFLQPNGFMMVELGAGQFVAVKEIFEDAGWDVEPPLLDFARIERVLVGRPNRKLAL